MTQLQVRRPASADQEQPLLAKPKGSQAAPLDPKALEAAQILKNVHGIGDTAALRLILSKNNGFGLNPQMDVQAVVVALTDSVGYDHLKQAYQAATGRRLEKDFAAQLGSSTTNRSGFKLNAQDQAELTNTMLDQHTKDRYIVGDQMLDGAGKADHVGANLFQGTTRNLAQRVVKLPPAVQKAQQHSAKEGGLPDAQGAEKVSDIRDPKVLNMLVTELEEAKSSERLDEFLQAFQQQRGKSIYAYLGETVRDPALRETVLQHLPQPISNEQLTFDAFLENIAMNMLDQTGERLEGQEESQQDDKRQGQPAALLDHFGYEASSVFSGKWGFEMRYFTPKPTSKRKEVIVAFRGTQGIKVAPGADGGGTDGSGESELPIGDFSPAALGYNQMIQNRDMIDNVLAKATKGGHKLLMTGHSLGGALAQIATVWYRENASNVVTFQGVNIDQEEVSRLKAHNTGKTNPVLGTHYRVDGDVVPSAGEEAIPGAIHYFDADWKLRGETDFEQGLQRSKLRAEKGHVIPILSMFIQEMDIPKDQKGLQVIAADGMKDEQEIKGLADTHVVYGGNYNTRRNPKADPRLKPEAGPDGITGLAKLAESKKLSFPKIDYKGIVEKELPYNTLLWNLEKIAKAAKDYEDFEKKAIAMMGLEDKEYSMISLEVDDKDIKLGESLGLNINLKLDIKDETLERIIRRSELLSGGTGHLRRIWDNFR